MKHKGVIHLQEKGHSTRESCAFLGASPSGFYKKKLGLPSSRSHRDGDLKKKIFDIFRNSKGTYGSPRITASLKRDGEKVCEDKVAKLMRGELLSAKKKRRFCPRTTINNPKDKKSERLFKIEENQVSRANEVWASDLTYLPMKSGFAYLVVVMDLFNREIIGWDLSDSMVAEKTKNALMKALKRVPGGLEGLVFHSDQGVQYCSSVFRERIKLLGIKQSMSRRGNCYDNAFVESFFHSLKNEIGDRKFEDLQDAKKVIFEYIEGWYNTTRLHSSLGYLSPMEYLEKNTRAS